MITEDYVSFETAKLLKEKGFDERLCTAYSEYGNLHRIFDKEFYETTNLFRTLSNSNYNDITRCKYDFFVTAPTLQMAMKWLREVHNIHIIAEPCLGEGNEPNLSFNRWFWTILEEEGEYKPIRKIDEFSTYEKAVEAAIKYCLEHLI